MRGRKAGTRPNAFAIDIKRTITGNLKRFISLFVITALGATMLVGLKAACDDLRYTADDYYDAQRLFDISVKSTLGLDEKDVEALSSVKGVEVAEGGYAETAYTQVGDSSQKVDLKALSPAGLNEPKVLEGRLPRDVDEVAVTQKYLDATGKKIGDTITFQGEDDAPADDNEAPASDEPAEVFERGEYTITAAVLDPMDVNAGSKTMSFRSTGGPQYAFFFTPGAVADRDTFTVAYLAVLGADRLMTYSDEYKTAVDAVKQRIEATREERELERTGRVRADANEAVDMAQGDANAQLDAAAAQLDAADSQIEDGRAQLERQRASAHEQLDEAQRQLDATRANREARFRYGESPTPSPGEGGVIQPLMGDAWPASAWQRLQNGDAAAKDEFVAAIDAYASEMSRRIDEGVRLCDELASAVGELPLGDPQVKQGMYDALDKLEEGGLIEPAQAERIRALVEVYPENEGDLTSIQAEIGELKRSVLALGELVGGLKGSIGSLADAALGRPALEAGQAEIDRRRAQVERQREKSQIAEGEAKLDEAPARARQPPASPSSTPVRRSSRPTAPMSTRGSPRHGPMSTASSARSGTSKIAGHCRVTRASKAMRARSSPSPRCSRSSSSRSPCSSVSPRSRVWSRRIAASSACTRRWVTAVAASCPSTSSTRSPPAWRAVSPVTRSDSSPFPR